MTSNGLYAVGTLLSWIGWIAAIRALILGLQIVLGTPGLDRARTSRGLLLSAAGAGALFLITALLPMKADGGEVAHVWRLPLVWFVMPWSAWLGVASFAMVVMRLAQAGLALNEDERRERLKAGVAWAVAAVVFGVIYRSDPANSIGVLKGGIALAPSTALGLGLLAVAALVAMVLAGRSLTTRGYARGAVVQAALIAGSFVFGLPFAFAVITSFKEDRDMSSPNGIVWVPRVQNTVPYFDRENPVYEGTYEGQTVQGGVIAQLPDGRVRIDIQKPLAIRGTSFEADRSSLKVVPVEIPLVTGSQGGKPFAGRVIKELDDGRREVQFDSPAELQGKTATFTPTELQPVRHIGLRWQNYTEALSFLPPETKGGLVYLKNTLVIVLMSVLGTVLSCSIVAYGFSRMNFPGKNALFAVLLSTMMLPGAVTLMPQFLIFRQLGWIDTLYPLWVPAFFASAFNVFMLRQFFMQIPMELEDASKIDGCGYLRTFWTIMLPQIKPALAVIAIWTFMASWNNFMGPLIYINSPENMPLSYALQLFKGDRSGEPGLLMAFATLSMLPVLALFFFAQRYFIEGVTLSGLGGR